MEDIARNKRSHSIQMSNRSGMAMTGITDVISFDTSKVVLESDYGAITIKGCDLHVNKLSVDKGELEVNGRIDAYEYSETKLSSKKGESVFNRLFG